MDASMRGALEVFAVDGLMNRCTGSIPYTSLQWCRRYYEVGTFTMEVPADLYSPEWRFIVCDARPETGIIQKRGYSDTSHTEDGRDTVMISGFFLEAVMNRHTFLDETPTETQERYYVSPPPSPVRKWLAKPKIYKGSDGMYWYSTGSGTSYGVMDGTASDSPDRKPGGMIKDFGENGASVETGSGTVLLTPVDFEQDDNTFYWKDKQSSTTMVTVKNNGKEETHNICFDDGKGSTYYWDSDGTLKRAVGVNKKNFDATYKQWSVENREYGGPPWGWRTRTIYTLGPWQTTEATEPVTEQDNVALCVKWARQYFQNQILFEDNSDITGVKKKLDPSFELLGDLLYQELQTVEASFRVRFLFDANQFIFSVWRGRDLTQETNAGKADAQPWVVFSDRFGTLYDFDASVDDSNYKNVCFVLYEYDEPIEWCDNGTPDLVMTFSPSQQSGSGSTGGTGTGGAGEMPSEVQLHSSAFQGDLQAMIQEGQGYGYEPTSWEIPCRTVRGTVRAAIDDGEDYDDRETYLDVRGDAPSFAPEMSGSVDMEDWQNNYGLPSLSTSLKSQYEGYEDNLNEQGLTKLNNDYPIVTNVDTGTMDASGYPDSYDLGDKVDVVIEKLGITETARIVGVDEVYESSGNSVTRKASIIIGNELVTSEKKARLI